MARVHDDVAPMPPASMPRLAPDDLAALDAWFAAGAPARTGGEMCDDTPPPPPPSTELPCTPSHEFVAHGPAAPDSKFDVPPTADNLHQCFTFRSPFGAAEQATAWAPIIDDSRVLHHWILYRTETEQPDGAVMPCNMPADATFLMGWAPGSGVTVMPDDVGLELRSAEQQWLILQVHYWNVPGYTDASDASGVAICTTDTPREKKAGVMTFGALGIRLPPRSTGVEVVGNCSSAATSLLREPLYLLSSGPHMRELGTRFSTEIIRTDGSVEELVRVDPWDFNAQGSYWHETAVPIHPGDALRTTCVYDNPTDRDVRFGERTEDEMCFNFALAYPIDIVGGRRACVF